jgi:hypothetical protein
MNSTHTLRLRLIFHIVAAYESNKIYLSNMLQ